jgi:hypothetical protein
VLHRFVALTRGAIPVSKDKVSVDSELRSGKEGMLYGE